MPKVPPSRRSKRTPMRNVDTCISENSSSNSSDLCAPVHRDHIHWAIFIAVSLLVTGAIIYVGRPDSITIKASGAPDTRETTEQGQRSIFGTVADINTDSITISSIRSTDTSIASNTVFTIFFDVETRFVYHPVVSTDNNQRRFGSQKGSLENISIGMYVSAVTLDEIVSGIPLNATEIGYSEENPFSPLQIEEETVLPDTEESIPVEADLQTPTTETPQEEESALEPLDQDTTPTETIETIPVVEDQDETAVEETPPVDSISEDLPAPILPTTEENQDETPPLE
ncbi:MAG: hypothetical protein Q8P11_04105 [bacterium]|nr:hypothetical protein [bacterium]